MIDPQALGAFSDNLQRALDDAVQTMVTQAIDNLVMDPEWITKMQRQVDQAMVGRVLDRLSAVDINSVVARQTDASLDRLSQRVRDQIARLGIQDRAASVQLTVMDDAVVVENTMITQHAHVMDTARVDGSLTVNNLIVRGVINTDNVSWNELAETIRRRAVDGLTQQWRDDMIQAVLASARTTGIDFAQVRVGDELVIDGDRLGAGIQKSSLREVGALTSLTVDGAATLTDTVHVSPRRVGINTHQPDWALSVWDEECAIGLGKLSQDRAYIGTSRRTALAIGVDRQPYLEIDREGLVTVRSLRLDRWRIGHATDVPGWSGTRGDLIFNSDPRPETPFGWVCLGGFRWQSLRSA